MQEVVPENLGFVFLFNGHMCTHHNIAHNPYSCQRDIPGWELAEGPTQKRGLPAAFLGRELDTDGHTCASIGVYGHLWASMAFHEHPWTSMDFRELPQPSTSIHA